MLGISVARESKNISEFTLRDSNVLKSVTALTALLLPPTFTAVCFFPHIVLSFFRCWTFFVRLAIHYDPYFDPRDPHIDLRTYLMFACFRPSLPSHLWPDSHSGRTGL